MQRKTQLYANNGEQTVTITREFDLPLELLFRAYADPDIVAQWMGTRVVKQESRQHGAWRYETSDPSGTVVFSAHGVFHDFVPNRRIVRTFEIENASFGTQMEFLEFESLGTSASKLNILSVYKSVEQRDQHLKLPYAFGLNMAHNRLQEILQSL